MGALHRIVEIYGPDAVLDEVWQKLRAAAYEAAQDYPNEFNRVVDEVGLHSLFRRGHG